MKEAIENCDMLFITAGMGGGTGTGASPVIAELAKELGILTVAVVTKPWKYEKKKRMKNAEIGIEELRSKVDSLIIIPNDKLCADKDMPLSESKNQSNAVLERAVGGIAELITKPGDINLDFADSEDSDCMTSLTITPPAPCSQPCTIIMNDLTISDCDENSQ